MLVELCVLQLLQSRRSLRVDPVTTVREFVLFSTQATPCCVLPQKNVLKSKGRGQQQEDEERLGGRQQQKQQQQVVWEVLSPQQPPQAAHDLLRLPLLRRALSSETTASLRLFFSEPGEEGGDGDVTATDLWSGAAALLLLYLLQNHDGPLQLRRRHRVIELGCGLGAISSLCTVLGAPQVVATDRDSAALRLAECNLRLLHAVQQQGGAAAQSRGTAVGDAAAAADSAISGGSLCFAAEGLEEAAAAALLKALQDEATTGATPTGGRAGTSDLRQQQQTVIDDVETVLRRLPPNPRAFSKYFSWCEDADAVLNTPFDGAAEKSCLPVAADSGVFCFHAGDGDLVPLQSDLVVGSDVLFSDASASQFASTLKVFARRNVKMMREGATSSSTPFLCLISHEVRHAVYLHRVENKLAKEAIDSALQIFLLHFLPLGYRAVKYCLLCRQSSWATGERTGNRCEPSTSDDLLSLSVGAAADAGYLWVSLLQVDFRRADKASGEGPPMPGCQPPDCSCPFLPEGATCLLGVSSDPQLLQALLTADVSGPVQVPEEHSNF